MWGESKGVEENVFTTHFDSGPRTVPRTHYTQTDAALPTICDMCTFYVTTLIQFTDVLHEYYTNVAHYTNFQKKSL